MTLCIENPKDSIKKLLEVLNELSKVAGYKVNSPKLVGFLYTNNEVAERECFLKNSTIYSCTRKNKIHRN